MKFLAFCGIFGFLVSIVIALGEVANNGAQENGENEEGRRSPPVQAPALPPSPVPRRIIANIRETRENEQQPIQHYFPTQQQRQPRQRYFETPHYIRHRRLRSVFDPRVARNLFPQAIAVNHNRGGIVRPLFQEEQNQPQQQDDQLEQHQTQQQNEQDGQNVDQQNDEQANSNDDNRHFNRHNDSDDDSDDNGNIMQPAPRRNVLRTLAFE